jgi:3-oxoacyl-[acyl-carrier protein] reductase
MSSKALSGKVALITGASKGIGRATALRLAQEGARVVITYGSDAAPANELVKTIGGNNAHAVKSDASSLSDIDHLVNDILQKFGKIDILVPNAGILAMKDLESTTERDFDNTMALNVKGPYFLAQVCISSTT